MNKYIVGIIGLCTWFGVATFFVTQVEAKVVAQASTKVSPTKKITAAVSPKTQIATVDSVSTKSVNTKKSLTKPVAKKINKKKKVKKYKNGTSALLSAPLIDPNNPPGGR